MTGSARVLIQIPALFGGMGGAEKVAANVANMLSDSGFDVTVMSNPGAGATPSFHLRGGIDIWRCAKTSVTDMEARAGDFDLLIGFGMAENYLFILRLARMLSCPFVIQECTNPERMVALLAINRQEGVRSLEHAFWARQAVLSMARAVRFTVPQYCESVIEGVRPHTYGFYNSFDIDDLSAADYSERPKKIVCVGALKNRNKNGLAALEAFAAAGLASEGWSLVFYGGNAFEREFEAINAATGAGAICAGVADPSEIYSDARLLIIPSYEEGLPNVVVEAFSCSVPCIGFQDCLGVNHLISNGRNGFLVPRNTASLAAKLVQFCSDEVLQTRFSRAAFKFAAANFDYDEFRTNWLTLVGNALRGLDNRGEERTPFGERDTAMSQNLRLFLSANT